jgi:hypothetical protein
MGNVVLKPCCGENVMTVGYLKSLMVHFRWVRFIVGKLSVSEAVFKK